MNVYKVRLAKRLEKTDTWEYKDIHVVAITIAACDFAVRDAHAPEWTIISYEVVEEDVLMQDIG